MAKKTVADATEKYSSGAEPLTYQKLPSVLTKIESGKSRVKLGDVREVLRILCELEALFRAGGPKDNLKGPSLAFKALEERVVQLVEHFTKKMEKPKKQEASVATVVGFKTKPVKKVAAKTKTLKKVAAKKGKK